MTPLVCCSRLQLPAPTGRSPFAALPLDPFPSSAVVPIGLSPLLLFPFPCSVVPTEPPDLPCFTSLRRVHAEEGKCVRRWPNASKRTSQGGKGGWGGSKGRPVCCSIGVGFGTENGGDRICRSVVSNHDFGHPAMLLLDKGGGGGQVPSRGEARGACGGRGGGGAGLRGTGWDAASLSRSASKVVPRGAPRRCPRATPPSHRPLRGIGGPSRIRGRDRGSGKQAQRGPTARSCDGPAGLAPEHPSHRPGVSQARPKGSLLLLLGVCTALDPPA